MLNQPAKCSPWTVGADYECTDYEFFLDVCRLTR